MKIIVKSKGEKTTIAFFLSAIVTYLVFKLFIEAFYLNDSTKIFIASWLGNTILILYLCFFYMLNKKVFTLFNILVAFMYLFNWGQCFMWSLGIHTDTEIGKTNLYSNYRIPTTAEILDAQFFTILMMLFFLSGSMISGVVQKRKNIKQKIGYELEDNVLYKISKFASFIIVPLTFARIFQTIFISYKWGYQALYYSDHSISDGLLTQVEYLFFPVLIGLLLGSHYNKKIRRNVYCIFAAYAVLYLLAGERGNWLYKLAILIWLEHKYYKPINAKKFIKWSVMGVVGLYVVYVIVQLRSVALSEISMEDITEALSLMNFPLISAIFEMGGNMGIITILLIEGKGIWNGYNTYIAAILGMPATFWLKYFGIDFTFLENWFSQDFLNISWGSGFSFIGEAFINGGRNFAFIYMIILGFFIATITKVNEDKRHRGSMLSIAFKVTSCNAFASMMRGSCHLSFKQWFLGVLLYLGFIKLIAIMYKRKLNTGRIRYGEN